jgi:uncharacterized membrane protein
VALVLAAALVGALLLRPDRERPVLATELGFSGQLVDATVATVDQAPCQGTEESDGIRCDVVAIDITSGPTKRDAGVFELPLSDATVRLAEGDRIVVQYQPGNPEDLRYFFQDFQRDHPLLLLVLLFAGAVVALGRWQGVRALIALVVSGIVLVAFAFPSILDGHDPTAVALVAAVVIAVAALYLTHGVNDMMTVALVGTFAALGVTAILAATFTHLAHFTGFGSEDAFYLQYASAKIDVRGLILAGIIIGSLGVLDDVTVTQASAVWQLHEANPGYSARHLYAAAVTIGRDHIASTVNTLVLAYAGASLPLLLLFAQAGRSLTEVAVGELVAVEVVRTLVGSIGLVSTVPLTTALAALVVTRGSSGRAGPTGPAAGPEPEPAPRDPPMAAPAKPVTWDRFAPDDEPRW